MVIRVRRVKGIALFPQAARSFHAKPSAVCAYVDKKKALARTLRTVASSTSFEEPREKHD
ncbi:exported hypothetical protein [uncultured Spirochaetota bacterium]|nr:exported hypothetical protein [uncultured Spirochaetota bacterium]